MIYIFSSIKIKSWKKRLVLNSPTVVIPVFSPRIGRMMQCIHVNFVLSAFKLYKNSLIIFLCWSENHNQCKQSGDAFRSNRTTCMPRFFCWVAMGRNGAAYIHETFPAFEITSVEEETLLRIWHIFLTVCQQTLQLERLQVISVHPGNEDHSQQRLSRCCVELCQVPSTISLGRYSSYYSSGGQISPSPKAGKVTGL